MELSVIIVNWNSKAYVRQCLQSLFTHCLSTPCEIIVVDSASFDGCGEMLAAEFPMVRFVQSEQNIGFGRSNNLGVRHASGKFLLFLNPDTLFQEDSIQILFRTLRTLPGASAVGAKLLNRDGTLQTSCVQTFPTLLNQVFDSEFLRERFPHNPFWGIAALYTEWPKPTVVEVISGACMLIRRDAFEAVGGFTESFFMYGEDLDLCFKLRRNGGAVYYVPDTRITHFGGGSTAQASSNFSNEMMRASVAHFIRLNRGPGAAFAYRMALGVSAILRLALIGPLLLFGRAIVRHGPDSWRKWWVILRWSVTGSPRQTPTPGHVSANVARPAAITSDLKT
jgi:GT2 family glycosyltransferase